jgi:hypothetical protein
MENVWEEKVLPQQRHWKRGTLPKAFVGYELIFRYQRPVGVPERLGQPGLGQWGGMNIGDAPVEI